MLEMDTFWLPNKISWTILPTKLLTVDYNSINMRQQHLYTVLDSHMMTGSLKRGKLRKIN